MDHPVQESRVCRIFRQTDLKYTLRGAESRDINLKTDLNEQSKISSLKFLNRMR